VPGNPRHVIYVWFDALTNYITALDIQPKPKTWQFLARDVHLIGKASFASRSLLANFLGSRAPLPQRSLPMACGPWKSENSKSLQNVVEPNMLIDRYGVDAVRYF